jgi:hypothetical protein
MGILADRFPMVRGFITEAGTSRTDPPSKEYWGENVSVKIAMDKKF